MSSSVLCFIVLINTCAILFAINQSLHPDIATQHRRAFHGIREGKQVQRIVYRATQYARI